MSCIEVMRKLADFLQGNLESPEATVVQRHVTHCHRCRLVFHSASETLRTYFPADEETCMIETHAA